MKILILAIFAYLAIAIPNNSISVHVNAAPKRENAKPRRDTLPDVQMSIGNPEAAERLTYMLDGETGVIIRGIDFCGFLKLKSLTKVYARINEVDADGRIVRTLAASEVDARRKLQATIPANGFFKIAIFAQGDYCNGIEYDFRFFGASDITPIHKFVHHSILCN